jgi:hypothetical protein
MKRFAAEVLFLNPDDVAAAAAALAAVDCEFEIDHDAIDDYGPTVFGTVSGATTLDENEIGDWLSSIISQHGGDVVEWGYGEPWRPSER